MCLAPPSLWTRFCYTGDRRLTSECFAGLENQWRDKQVCTMVLPLPYNPAQAGLIERESALLKEQLQSLNPKAIPDMGGKGSSQKP